MIYRYNISSTFVRWWINKQKDTPISVVESQPCRGKANTTNEWIYILYKFIELWGLRRMANWCCGSEKETLCWKSQQGQRSSVAECERTIFNKRFIALLDIEISIINHTHTQHHAPTFRPLVACSDCRSRDPKRTRRTTQHFRISFLGARSFLPGRHIRKRTGWVTCQVT